MARGHNEQKSVTLQRRAAILRALERVESMDKCAAATVIGQSPEAASRLLGELADEGRLRRLRPGRYALSKELA